MTPPLLVVDELSVRLGPVAAVSDVSFQVSRGEFFGVVGESGAGKSATARAIVGLLPPHAEVTGSVRFDGEELLGAPARRLRLLRGGAIGFVFQDALAALDPVYTVGEQLAEALMAHRPATRDEARAAARALLDEVRIADPDRCLRSYPHQLSGGMRQRVLIAIALIADPALVIADEPTSALDVTVQRRVLDLLIDVCRNRGTAVILVTHDLGVVAQTCDRVAVLYGGLLVEEASTIALFDEQRHPYTRALLHALPRLGGHGPLVPIPGSSVQILDELVQCPFAPRCPLVIEACHAAVPAEIVGRDRRFRCVHEAAS